MATFSEKLSAPSPGHHAGVLLFLSVGKKATHTTNNRAISCLEDLPSRSEFEQHFNSEKKKRDSGFVAALPQPIDRRL